MPPLRLLTRRAESLFSDREQNHGRVWGRKQQLFWYGVIHSALCTVLITFTSVGRIQFRMASMMRLLHAPASPVWPCATGPIGMVPLLHTGVPWLAPPREALILRSSPMALVSRRARELQYKLHAAPLTLCSTSLRNRACMAVMDAGPDWLAPLAPPAPYGLRGAGMVQRAVRCSIERSLKMSAKSKRARP